MVSPGSRKRGVSSNSEQWAEGREVYVQSKGVRLQEWPGHIKFFGMLRLGSHFGCSGLLEPDVDVSQRGAEETRKPCPYHQDLPSCNGSVDPGVKTNHPVEGRRLGRHDGFGQRGEVRGVQEGMGLGC